MRSMHILLTGSRGFIGRTFKQALQNAGHTVLGGVSPGRSPGPGECVMDFAHDTRAEVWLPRLQGVDAVINTVGVLRDSRSRPIDAVHRDTPVALFSACAQAGVRRVVQISALGIEGSPTRYASTKRAADQHLLGLAAARAGPVRWCCAPAWCLAMAAPAAPCSWAWRACHWRCSRARC